MAENKIKIFYRSPAFRACADEYYNLRGGLCESCLKNESRYTQGVWITHRVPLSNLDLMKPEVCMNWDNMLLLCPDCWNKRKWGARIPHPPRGVAII